MTLLLVAAVLILGALAIVLLVRVGRRVEVRALAMAVPDCLVLFRRLAGDPRTPRRSKLLLLALVVYLAMPFDLVPDFIPVLGQLDDAILITLVLRAFLRTSGTERIREHWPGSESMLRGVLRVAGPSAQ